MDRRASYGVTRQHTGYRSVRRPPGQGSTHVLHRAACVARLRERQDPFGRRPEVPVGAFGRHAAPRGPLQESELQQVGLDDVLDRIGLLPDGRGERGQAHGPPAELVDHGRQDREIELVQALLVHLEQLETGAGHLGGHGPVVADLGEVADPPEQSVGHPRRAPGPPGDLARALVVHHDAQDPGRPVHDRAEVLDGVVVQPGRETEPLPQRQRDAPRPRGRADEREPRQVEPDAPGARALAEHDVELEVLERGIQDLRDRARHPEDLVHEQDVALLEVGQDRREVARAVERRSRRRLEPDAELVGDDPGQRRLAEPRRSGEQEVVDGLAAGARAVDQQGELLLDAVLADELVDPAGPERGVELALLLRHLGVDDAWFLGHVAHHPTPAPSAFVPPMRCKASRRRSSVERPPLEGSPAIASLASWGDRPSASSASRTSTSGPSTITTSPPSRSFRSRTTRWATFLPTPGTTVSAATSPEETARRSASGVSTDRNDSATFGPTPFTVTSRSNSSRSSALPNPNSVIASSRTTMRVWILAVLPTGGRAASVDAGTWTSYPTPCTEITTRPPARSATSPSRNEITWRPPFGGAPG